MRRWHLPVFLLFVFLTFFDNAIQWYTHAETYPISALVGPEEFVEYGDVYEARLVLALYIPYSILMLANLLLIARPIGSIPRSAFVVTFVCNLSILLISLFLAVPQHTVHAAQGYITPEQLNGLLQVNTLRLAAAFTSTGIVAWMLTRLIAPRAAHPQNPRTA